jgi:hypothetical protein
VSGRVGTETAGRVGAIHVEIGFPRSPTGRTSIAGQTGPAGGADRTGRVPGARGSDSRGSAPPRDGVPVIDRHFDSRLLPIWGSHETGIDGDAGRSARAGPDGRPDPAVCLEREGRPTRIRLDPKSGANKSQTRVNESILHGLFAIHPWFHVEGDPRAARGETTEQSHSCQKGGLGVTGKSDETKPTVSKWQFWVHEHSSNRNAGELSTDMIHQSKGSKGSWGRWSSHACDAADGPPVPSFRAGDLHLWPRPECSGSVRLCHELQGAGLTGSRPILADRLANSPDCS